MRTLTRAFRIGPSGRPGPAPRERARRGFSIVEAIIAIVLLAFGVLAMASSSAMTIREMRSASQRVQDSSLAATRFEQLRAVDACTAILSKASSLGMTATRANTNPDMVQAKLVLPAVAGLRRVQQVYTTGIPCS